MRNQPHTIWRSWLFWIILVTVLLLTTGSAYLAPTLDDPVRVPANTTVDGNVATIIDSIRVDGTVTGDVTSWSGNITINGVVGGDVVSYAGQVQISPLARVSGNVLGLAGTQQDVQGFVQGQSFGEGQAGGRVIANIVDLFVPGPSNTNTQLDSAGQILFAALFGLFVLILGSFWLLIWPRRTHTAAQMLQVFPLRSLLVGLSYTLFLAVILPPLSVVLLASVFGIPLLLILLLLLHIPWVYGLATISRQLAGTVSPNVIGQIAVCAALGLLCAIGMAIQPMIGIALFYLLASAGAGAVFLSRGGTAVPMFARS